MVIDRMGDLPRDIVIQKAEALGGGLVVMLLYIEGGEKGLGLGFETPEIWQNIAPATRAQNCN